MSIDATKLGQLTAEVMETLSDEFDEADGYSIRTAVVIAEVDSPTASRFWWKCSDDRIWLLEKLLDETLDEIDRLRRGAREAEDEND